MRDSVWPHYQRSWCYKPVPRSRPPSQGACSIVECNYSWFCLQWTASVAEESSSSGSRLDCCAQAFSLSSTWLACWMAYSNWTIWLSPGKHSRAVCSDSMLEFVAYSDSRIDDGMRTCPKSEGLLSIHPSLPWCICILPRFGQLLAQVAHKYPGSSLLDMRESLPLAILDYQTATSWVQLCDSLFPGTL